MKVKTLTFILKPVESKVKLGCSEHRPIKLLDYYIVNRGNYYNAPSFSHFSSSECSWTRASIEPSRLHGRKLLPRNRKPPDWASCQPNRHFHMRPKRTRAVLHCQPPAGNRRVKEIKKKTPSRLGRLWEMKVLIAFYKSFIHKDSGKMRRCHFISILAV